MKTLPSELQASLEKYSDVINARLDEFKNIKREQIFYEFCFCIMTPQSSAKNAWAVQKILESNDFYHKPFAPTEILANTQHYIRFHNQKAKRLMNAVEYEPTLMQILDSTLDKYGKRNRLKKDFVGIGMKEASHFLRNIGYTDLAIIDRHILRNLHNCGVIESVAPPKNDKQYLEIERKYYDYSVDIGIAMDVLDLLFFAHSTGEVLK
ncbi:MAG: N-glycosylase/DNA lyase [Ignavibacteria bacterium]|jgi:N-glycosylase/DNA lyase|nr:N-glycosylase/DNA lyase [Ignavibacteria bacterium]